MSTQPFIKIMIGNVRGIRTRKTGTTAVLEEAEQVVDVAEQAGFNKFPKRTALSVTSVVFGDIEGKIALRTTKRKCYNFSNKNTDRKGMTTVSSD